MSPKLSRRGALRLFGAVAGAGALAGLPLRSARADRYDEKTAQAIKKGLEWVARTQSRIGHWNAGNYPAAMTALAGTALVASGSTTMQGPYASNVRRAVDYLFTKRRENGLIGEPLRDNRYTYGHGFSMVFLSQILGEEEDEARREELTEVLTKAVEFTAFAQTPSGGWGYVSAKDGNNFDEGSTTITQVQGLRACRNAGIPVDKDIIDRAKKYIYDCKNEDGGISYSSRNRGSSRPAITAAALAALYNAGAYDSEHVPEMWEYTKGKLHNVNANAAETFGHWDYTYLYYSQVVYRRGAEEWAEYCGKLYEKIIREQEDDGSWNGTIGPIYVTACKLIMLQLDLAYLPIYQR